jgi:hypothetical protein
MTAVEGPRVLHVVATEQRGGAETFAADLVGALVGLGVEQRVVILRARAGGLRYPVPTAAARRGRPLRGFDPPTLRGLRRAVASWGPSVVQAHGGEALKHAALAVSGAPVAYRKIGMAAPWDRSGPSRRLHGALLRRARCVVAVTEAARREAVELFGVPEERTVRIPKAVDGRRVVPGRGREAVRAELGVDSSAPVAVAVGGADVGEGSRRPGGRDGPKWSPACPKRPS